MFSSSYAGTVDGKEYNINLTKKEMEISKKLHGMKRMTILKIN